jgi:hypothetical protein
MAASEAAAQLKKLRMAISAFGAVYTTSYIAKDTGLFKKHGLDVELILIDTGPIVHALIAGDLQVAAVGGSRVVASAVEGSGLRLLAATNNRMPYKLIVSAGVRSPSQLIGKKVGVGAFGYVVLPLIIIAMFEAAMTLPFLMLKGMLLSGNSQITLPSPDSGVIMPAPLSSPLPEGSGTGTLQPPAGKEAEATGEALIVRDGVQEIYQLQTGFLSDTRMVNPGRATVEFQLPAEPHSNARRIEMTLDATRHGEYIIDGKAMNDRMFDRSQGQTPLAATFQFVADGGQIYPPKETCRLIISSPYTGTADSVFSGEVQNCVVHSAGIDHTISAKFTMRGVSSR